MNTFASFGWELANLNGNGADAYFPVTTAMTLNVVNIDASLMWVSSISAGWAPGSGSATAGGWAEVLCQGKVFRGSPPNFAGGNSQAYLPAAASADFGYLSWYNPSNLKLVGNGFLDQDMFYATILKAFLTNDGMAASTQRQTSLTPAIALNPGDYLAFHMDHQGVTVDCEMQIVLGYTLA